MHPPQQARIGSRKDLLPSRWRHTNPAGCLGAVAIKRPVSKWLSPVCIEARELTRLFRIDISLSLSLAGQYDSAAWMAEYNCVRGRQDSRQEQWSDFGVRSATNLQGVKNMQTQVLQKADVMNAEALSIVEQRHRIGEMIAEGTLSIDDRE